MADISTLTIGGTQYNIKDNIANGGHYGGQGNTTKIKININSTTSWMLSFVVTLYQGYRATKVMISGYQYGNNYWYEPEAVILGDSNYTETITVYFGYDAATKLWVGFDGGQYTGVTITDVVNGYTQITDYTNLFTISNVSSLATIQKTITAESRANYANSAAATAKLTTARTIWGQSFDGSANISGNMTGIGPSLYLPANQNIFEFLTSAGGAAISKFSKILLSENYSQGDLTNYKLYINNGNSYIGGSLTATGGVYLTGSDLHLKTPSSSSNDSGDIIWYYGNGQEKMRIWSTNEYTANSGPNYRIYKSDGTALYSGTLALADHTHSYLPLSGGILTGNLAVSGAGEKYVQATNTNTGHSIYLDSSSSLAGIWSSKKNGWALQVDTSGNVTLNGNATTASGLSSTLPTLAAATESNEITVKDLGNNAPANSQAHRHGIDFKWYNTHWLIGNLRSGSTDSHGFGISYSADGTTYTNTFKISPTGNITATSFNGYTIAKSVPSNAVFTDTNTWRPIGTGATDAAAGNHTHSYLPLSGGTMTGKITANTGNGLEVQSSNSGSWKEGIRIYDTSSGYSVLALMNSSANDVLAMVHNGTSHYYYIDIQNGSNYYKINFPLHGGTFALTDGYGASGTWGINVTGSAGSVAWGNVTGKPSSFTPASHDHNRVLDAGNNNGTTFAYSKDGLDTTSWFAAWNGYELRAISPAKVLSTIGALPLTGGTLTLNNDATLQFYAGANTEYGSEAVAIQTCFDCQTPSSSNYVTNYENRCNLLLQPRGGQVYIGKNLTTSTGDTNHSLIVEGGISGNLTGNVTGNCSGTAGSVAWANITGKPSTYAPSSHGHGVNTTTVNSTSASVPSGTTKLVITTTAVTVATSVKNS